MPDADAEGSIGDPDCGDALTFYVKVTEGRISDISYLVFGCCAAIATSSATSVLAKGKTIEEAMKITEDDVVMPWTDFREQDTPFAPRSQCLKMCLKITVIKIIFK